MTGFNIFFCFVHSSLPLTCILLNCIDLCCVALYFFPDSSKQRQKLRTKMSREKELWKKVVANYNELVNKNNKITTESIQKGDFPWDKQRIVGSPGGKRCESL